jgi:hypothetical protein
MWPQPCKMQRDPPGYLRESLWVPLSLLLVPQDGSQGASQGASTGPLSPGVDPPPTLASSLVY